MFKRIARLLLPKKLFNQVNTNQLIPFHKKKSQKCGSKANKGRQQLHPIYLLANVDAPQTTLQKMICASCRTLPFWPWRAARADGDRCVRLADQCVRASCQLFFGSLSVWLQVFFKGLESVGRLLRT